VEDKECRTPQTHAEAEIGQDTHVLKVSDRLVRMLKLVNIPRFAKILIPLQTLLNMLLVFWIYEEYASNRYLREYVSDSLRAGAVGAVVLVSTGLLIVAAMVLYAKLRSYREELRAILSKETLRPMEEGLVNRSIRELRKILLRLFGKLRRS
jgi:hypothetical protein